MWDSWHTEEELLDIVSGGIKKLTNYQKSVNEFKAWKEYASPEEVEQALINIEMGRNDFKDWVVVERIVASRTVPTAQVREMKNIRKFRNKRLKSLNSPPPKNNHSSSPTNITNANKSLSTPSSASPPPSVKLQPNNSISSTSSSSSPSPLSSPVPETPDASVSMSSVWAMAAQQADAAAAATVKTENSPNGNLTESAVVKLEPIDSSSVTMEVDPRELNGEVATKTEQTSAESTESPQADAEDEDKDDDDDDDDDDDEEDEDDEDDDYDDSSVSTMQYFVKWQGLPYEENTWECFEDIMQYQDKIDYFMNGGSVSAIAEIHNKYPGLMKKVTDKSRKNFQPLKEQPGYLTGGELRNYQLDGLNWLAYSWANNVNGILADEMGQKANTIEQRANGTRLHQ